MSEIRSETKATEITSTWQSTYHEILWGPLMWFVDTILLFLAYGDAISKIVPSSQETLEKFAFLSSLPWYWKIIAILLVNMLLMGRGALRGLRKREEQRDSYALQLKQISDAKPHLVLRQPNAEHITKIRFENRIDGIILGEFSFVKVRFVNRPHGVFPNSVAKAIRAKVSFYNSSQGGSPLLEMDGRWDDSDAPFTRESGKSRNDLLMTDFGIEEEHGLDIVYKDKTGKIVAFNNDNYNYEGLIKPEHVLAGNKFLVQVRLVGVWVDEIFAFKFSDTPEGLKITRPVEFTEGFIFGKD